MTNLDQLSDRQKQLIIEKTHHYIDVASSHYNEDFEYIPVYFDLSSRTSGMFVVKGMNKYIRYNPVIFSAYFDDSVINTVAHEVAHYIVYQCYGHTKVRPHGREWKSIMDVFGAKPDVTSQYDLSQLPLRRQQQFTYLCECSEHQLSATRHNRVQRNMAIYSCKKCCKPLKLAS